ncbi:hypothetical protein ROZALSC1DRAFT_5427, partial [Rozella allomycis CSF55]
KKYFIAANLHNNQEVLPKWCSTLLKFSNYVGNQNVHVSIYESGSNDKTVELLEDFKSKLNERSISNSITLNGSTRGRRYRIDFLADVRNQALDSLYQLNVKYDFIIFLNDVYFNLDDLLELIMTRNGNYDAVCPMDYYWTFYDQFATRDSDGNPASSEFFPYFSSPDTVREFRQFNPAPVYAC